jgi:glutamine phosphoribosylpyrophosphate amidotransferase
MCVIAGYIGSKPAAPILLEMLQRQEGIDAGFYSGIATLDRGRLHWEKVVGDTAALLERTPAMDLPGNIGIIHSRTNSGGGREWGHPFVDTAEQLAYIANGAGGQFDSRSQLSAACEELMAAGHRFRSAQPGAVGNYPQLSDGRSVHMSDALCQVIAAAYRSLEGRPGQLIRAMAQAFERFPSEIVGLCIHAAHPDSIAAARHNKPLEIGRDANGAIYLASTTIGFPPGVRWHMRMPPQAAALFHRDGRIEIQPLAACGLEMGAFPSALTIEERVRPLLRGGEPTTTVALREAVGNLWPAGALGEREIAIYELLGALQQEGKVRLENVMRPGVNGQGQAPQTRVHWVE